MSDSNEASPLQIYVGFAPELLGAVESTAEQVRRAVAAELSALMEQLGLPGQPAVSLAPLEPDGSGRQLLRLSVDGAPCRYPDSLLARVYSVLTGEPVRAPDLDAIRGWLADLEDEPSQLASFLGRSCAAILARDPSQLLTPGQLDAYLAAFPAGTLPPDLERETLLAILREPLRLRVALRDRDRIADLLRESAEAGRSPEETAETLIAALRPAQVVLSLHPEDLLRLPAPDQEVSLFTLMRDGLFYELGMRYPDFRLVPDPSLPLRSFAIQVNDLVGLPWVGLGAGEILVNQSAERLRQQGIDAIESQNPANEEDAAVAGQEFQQRLEEAGLTTWDQPGYMVLCLSRELREAAPALVDWELTAGLLNQLEEIFPALAGALMRQASVEFVTRVLRQLLAEQISIRNLRQIAESILRFEAIVIDSRRYIVFDERFPVPEVLPEPVEPGTMAAYIRTQMKEAISHKYSRGQNSLRVLLLEPALEEALATGGLNGEATERLLAAVREEMAGYAPGTAYRPAILTDASVRAQVAELLAAAYPDVPVLAYQELSPAMNLQAVARIELSF
jgi:type III secretory pathway component EscV